jgi:cell surface protein SprA
LNTPTSPAAIDSSTTWGRVPVNPIKVTNAFSNNPGDRVYQDVGFDGLDNAGERRKRTDYLSKLTANFGTASAIYQRAIQGPSNDDSKWYRDPSFDASGAGFLERYKNFNHPQGNSPIATGTSPFSPAATLYPDNEDLNRDNTLNEDEEYFEYQINLAPGMDVGVTKYISDKRVVPVTYADGTIRTENWYLFRVPLSDYASKTGQILDFKSIQFMRMYLTEFQDSVVLRFAKLELVRNQWRQFTYNLDTTGSYTPIDTRTITFNTLAVNLEENSSRTHYVILPGIQRVQQLSNNGINILQNEQSLSLQVGNLTPGNARAVFKTLQNYDMRLYGRMLMFARVEAAPNTALQDNQLNLVVRIGQDYLKNYYEIKVPLKVTPPGNYSPASDTIVWPTRNNLDFDKQTLINLKLETNNSGASISTIYRQVIGNKTFSVLGNPNIGAVNAFLIGVESAITNTTPLSAEVWIDELRLSNINETGAYAATGTVDIGLSDLGKMSISGSMHTAGWGSLESHIGQRALDNFTQFDASMAIDAGKLFPSNAR